MDLGPLRPAAWDAILTGLNSLTLAPGHSAVRHDGGVGYVAEGLLKEYDARSRSRPAIVNFLGPGDAYINRPHTVAQYLKATGPTTVLQLSKQSLRSLHAHYPELQQAYERLSLAYDTALAFRSQLLESDDKITRLRLFKDRFRHLLPYLRIKDVANYTVVSYDYCARRYHSV